MTTIVTILPVTPWLIKRASFTMNHFKEVNYNDVKSTQRVMLEMLQLHSDHSVPHARRIVYGRPITIP